MEARESINRTGGYWIDGRRVGERGQAYTHIYTAVSKEKQYSGLVTSHTYMYNGNGRGDSVVVPARGDDGGSTRTYTSKVRGGVTVLYSSSVLSLSFHFSSLSFLLAFLYIIVVITPHSLLSFLFLCSFFTSRTFFLLSQLFNHPYFIFIPLVCLSCPTLCLPLLSPI